MTPRSRFGFTLTELLVSLCLATLSAGIALSVVAQQQRITRSIDAMLSVHDPLRDASDVLATVLRSNSVTTDTLQLATDTAVELFVTIGASTLCAPPSGVTLSLPPDTQATGATLTAWLTVPDSGDYALLYRDSTTSPTWERLAIQKITEHPIAALCPSSPLITPADIAAHKTGYTVTLAAAPTLSIRAGTPIRFIRRARYSVYRASDRQWYLGYRRCNTSCDVIQPVAGPYGNTATPPLTLRYYGSDGNLLSATTQLTRVARIGVIARAVSSQPLQLPGTTPAPFIDSAMTSIAFLNH